MARFVNGACQFGLGKNVELAKNGWMPNPNNISRLRKAKGLTLERLEELTGISYSYLSRLQSGERSLSVENAELIARALGASAAEVLGLVRARGGEPAVRSLEDELVPYHTAVSDPLRALIRDNEVLMQVKSSTLTKIGINADDLLVIDTSEKARKNPPALRPVSVSYRPPNGPSRTFILLRQFVPPALLITNSRINEPMIDMESEQATIGGVVIRKHHNYA